ncbi:MAG TPA: LytTR family DNA-binding domain-containing protein [Bacteroidales bacterium]|nr:LytTR family DNA-binding domain-containing protein [Bacteroidales bacterium]
MTNKLPDYLLKKKNIFLFLAFVALFSILFINIYKPFNSILWVKNVAKSVYFLFSGLIVISGISVMLISRLVMLLLKSRMKITIVDYFIWIIVEILIMSTIYSFAAKEIYREPIDFFDIFPNTVLYITLTLFLPYLVSWLYFALQEKNSAIAKLVEMNRYIDEENYVSLGNEKQNLIHFHDEKGTLRLSIKFSKLYYIEAADNYVNIYYENKGKISRFLLRKSLKSIEDSYKEYPLIRCHRSYIINVEKVKVLKKEKDGTYLDFDFGEINVIPVSKTYSQNIIDIFYK